MVCKRKPVIYALFPLPLVSILDAFSQLGELEAAISCLVIIQPFKLKEKSYELVRPSWMVISPKLMDTLGV